MSGMLILTLPFHVFFLVPKGVILPVEGSPHSSAGLHSLTSQSERGGLRSPAPTWTRLAPSCPPPSVPARFPSSHLYKQATLRVVACSWVTKSWMGKRGTPLQLVRHRGPSAVLPVPPVRLLCLWLVLKAPALALIAPPLLPQRKPLPLLKWNSDRISIGKPFPALWKSTAAAQTLMRLDLCWSQMRTVPNIQLKLSTQAPAPQVWRQQAKEKPRDGAKVRQTWCSKAQTVPWPPTDPAAERLEPGPPGLLRADWISSVKLHRHCLQ